MTPTQLLHDATLKRIDLDWAAGSFTAVFVIGADKHEVQLVGKGVTSFAYERRFPWGRSVSVNKCDIDEGAGGDTVKIEMQSGDTLIGKGESFTFSH
jgi:hypothetical protein